MLKITQKSKIAGFTLVEMAISLTIVSFLLMVIVGFFSKNNDAERHKKTIEKIAKIEEAIATFVNVNNYIPCPAQGNALEDNSNGYFGDSAAASVYDSTTHTCLNNTTNYVGMVPVRNLNLPDEYAYDGWGRKFSFRVATGYGSAADFATMGSVSNATDSLYFGDIIVAESSTNTSGFAGSAITGNFRPGTTNYGAAYVIISHGPSGTGAWGRNSSAVPTTPSTSSLEYQNATHLTASPSSLYIQGPRSYLFNNIVAFKKKTDLVNAKQLISPFKVPNQTCSNANIFLANSASSAVTGVAPAALAQQLYSSALAVKALCNNPPLKSANSASSCLVNPLMIKPSNLKLWLDGSDPLYPAAVPANGTAITTWYDKSGNGNNATRTAGTSSYSTSTPFAGSKGAINFNPYYTINLSYLFNTSYTIIAVFVRSTGGAISMIIGAPTISTVNKTPGLGFYLMGAITYPFIQQYANDLTVPGSVFQTTQTPTLMMGIKDTTNGRWVSHRSSDGTVMESYDTEATPLNVSATTAWIGSGAAAGTRTFTGYIGEILIYNAALTIPERRAIEGYLTRKWFSGECP